MFEFFRAFTQNAFLTNAVLTGVLASIACGMVGTWVVTRRISYLAGSISHCVLGGLGWARYMAVVHQWDWLLPAHGALLAATMAALVIGWVSLKSKEREDTVIGAIWAIGMALGVIFIAMTPGYSEDIMSYLFGNILMTGAEDMYAILALDAVILLVCLLFYNKLSAVCFDEEFARIRGVNVEFFYLLLLVLVGLTVVLLTTVVGVVLVIALLTLPAAIAGMFTRTLKGMMAAASVLSICFVVLGLAVSYEPGLPTGATIILFAGGVYVLAGVGQRLVVGSFRK